MATMKKITLLMVALTSLTFATTAQERRAFFLGGTAAIGYSDNFEFALEPIFGYEITDWVAIGTGLGLTLIANDQVSAIGGIAEPFVRFTPWHNELVYIDLKTTAAFGFNDELLMTQIGIRPSIRFRVNDKCDIAADFGLFGAQCTYSKWRPIFGITGTSVGLWAAYRF